MLTAAHAHGGRRECSDAVIGGIKTIETRQFILRILLMDFDENNTEPYMVPTN